ncbi:MerR family transcriptional regulator [Nocardia panacis]|uniref:MerR family transcriptional regulator n=1 Tax=Nocardia panacis TaxID=2340916 RepID=A0A3A4KLY0_9NOCA|nr:MerR family transcriptional regulator [Nocardia panacis]RJO77982.1 MerR family transcriptional regulator [Nocardia panacis]
MTATVSIGEFARLTHLSVKTLRHYHDIDLLEPVSIDAGSGYRRYGVDQVPRAHLIRRLRALDMPLPQIKAVLTAPNEAARDASLRAHLERMEAELARTRAVVASLRSLLTPAAPLAVEYRAIPAFPALAVTGRVAMAEIDQWCPDAFYRLHTALAAADITAPAPDGCTYAMEFFEDEIGAVVAFVPLPAGARLEPPAGTALIELPARRFVIAVHAGDFDSFDLTYGALGSYVAEHGGALAEPVRENYLVGPGDHDDPSQYRTEVCWPIGRL